VGMVGFRNNVGSAGLSNWVSSSSSQIAFSRGSAGFVAINSGSSAWTATFSSGLSAGTYCDVISGAKTGTASCSGSSYALSHYRILQTKPANMLTNVRFTVLNAGTFSATIPARSAIAIHTGAKISGSGGTTPTSTTTTGGSTPTSGSVTVNFAPTVTTVYGQNVYIAGSLSQLGSWTPASGVGGL
jgi:hypothetical protein